LLGTEVAAESHDGVDVDAVGEHQRHQRFAQQFDGGGDRDRAHAGDLAGVARLGGAAAQRAQVGEDDDLGGRPTTRTWGVGVVGLAAGALIGERIRSVVLDGRGLAAGGGVVGPEAARRAFTSASRA
jgi:hypothetical protein